MAAPRKKTFATSPQRRELYFFTLYRMLEAALLALCTRSFKARCVIFCTTKTHAHRVRVMLGLAGLRASELHGNLTQNLRLSALEDFRDARRVADGMGMPHYVLDFEERFRRAVIDDFADSYVAGETPIPCVRCNQRVKFRDLLDVARDLGADALATGH